MKIQRPIGAILSSEELPGGSFVNTEIIAGSDGLPDLLMRSSLPGELEGGGGLIVSVSDLRAIYQWATEDIRPSLIVRATLGARTTDPPVAFRRPC